MNIHDSAYKKLFSNRTFARDLLVHFVEEPWVHLLDFERATIVNKSFIGDQYKENEADLIYQFPVKGTDKFVYVYLLIEFQSTVDRFMVVRVGHYIHSFYLEYRDNTEKVKLLPQLFPIVLYNGRERWTAPTVLSELIEQAVDFGDFGVATRYFPVIINEIPLEKLLAEENIVSTLFMAEGHYNVNLIIERLLTLYEAGDHKAVSLLANWYRQMYLNKRVSNTDYVLLEEQYRSKEEIHSMIVESILKEEEKLRNRIIADLKKNEEQLLTEIKIEGKIEGKREQQRLTAQRMIAGNYALPVIADLLGLAEDEVQALLVEEAAQV
jgi:predicted transposase/invertase (TIGR01784 family)